MKLNLSDVLIFTHLFSQINITSISLMTDFMSEIPEEGLPTIIQTFQNHGTIQNLLHDMSFYLKVLHATML